MNVHFTNHGFRVFLGIGTKQSVEEVYERCTDGALQRERLVHRAEFASDLLGEARRDTAYIRRYGESLLLGVIRKMDPDKFSELRTKEREMPLSGSIERKD